MYDRITLRLTVAELAWLDERRTRQSRQDVIRGLIEREMTDADLRRETARIVAHCGGLSETL